MPRRRSQAFTLIELLVVTAIIVVLIGLLTPSLARARETAKATKCGATLRQWGIAAHMYATLNEGSLPSKGADGSHEVPLTSWTDMSVWFNALPSQFNNKSSSYYDLQQAAILASAKEKDPGNADRVLRSLLPLGGQVSIFVCPSATTAGPVQDKPDGVAKDWAYFDASYGPYFGVWGKNSTGALERRPAFICYMWNSKMVHGDPSMADDVRNALNLKLAQLSRASPRLILMSEKRMRQDELQPNDPLNPVASDYNNYHKPLSQFKGDWNRFTTRHFNGGNVLFIDGSVSLLTYHDVNTPTISPLGGGKGDWNHASVSNAWAWDPFYAAN